MSTVAEFLYSKGKDGKPFPDIALCNREWLNAWQMGKNEFDAANAPKVQGFKYGVLFNGGAFWLGWNWSPFNRRLCVNLVPCITVWVKLAGGKPPERATR